MASEGLECSICCERFDEEKLCPRLLSCGHSFCSNCLEKLVIEYVINCPTCRRAVSVPAGVTGLPKNFALLDVLQATPQTPADGNGDLRLCEVCDDEKHPATSCCLDCKEDMCKDAARWHTRHKAAREHRVVSLEELKANPKLAAVPIFCPEHNEQYRFFDEECNHVVCRDCVTLKHNGHKCLSLAEAASKYRQEMEALVTKASTHADGIKAAEARVAAVSLDLNKAYEEQTAQIKGAFKELYAALFAREQALLNELEQLHKTKAFTLTEQRDRLRIFQACLDSAVQRAMSTVQSGNTELLVTRADVAATLEAMEKQPLSLEPQEDCALDFNVNLEQLLDLLSNAGIVSEKATCAANTTAEGAGLEMAIPEREVLFTITARDAQGCLRGVGGDLFMVDLTATEEVKFGCKAEDKGDGTYVVTYTSLANSKGCLRLSVRLRGTHIKGSPFVVNVTEVPVGEIICYFCGQRTKSMNYYRNNREPLRNDPFRVNGYSALCFPQCEQSYLGSTSCMWTKCCGPF